jgi:hypothetical protein
VRSGEDTITIPVWPIIRIVVGLLLGSLLLATGFVIWAHRDDLVARPTADRYIDESAYQAVFLSSQQVYFGKLRVDGDLYLLSDVYYLSTPEGGQGGGQLVKRGAELHGPKEPMIIPAHDVLFVENMREDSQVVTAIHAAKSGQLPAQPTPSATVGPSPTR